MKIQQNNALTKFSLKQTTLFNVRPKKARNFFVKFNRTAGIAAVITVSSIQGVTFADDVALPPATPGIPMTGIANAAFKPVDDAIRRFMKERCVGAAIIGIAYNGTIIHNRGYGYKNGPPSSACATAQDPFVGGDTIQPNTPFRIGSNSKAVLAAVFRIEIKKALAVKRGVPLNTVTDSDIEELKLIDNGEIELVSPKVRAAMLANPNRNSFVSKSCAVVDPWQRVTIGQLLTHHSGLPSGAEDIYEELSNIRGLNTATKLAAQETASGAPLDARTALKDAYGNNAYFVPPSTLEEFAIAQGNICFAHEPGTINDYYSNSGFGILAYVLEHVTGKTFNAKNGYPFMHSWSLLSDFTETELGFSTGIELSHEALGKRDPAEPRYRNWSVSTYYPNKKDEKRPWCQLIGSHCEFNDWQAGNVRFDWKWQPQQVPFTYERHSMTGGVGLLAAEAPKYLAFMNQFWVRDPYYGGDRELLPVTSDREHYGSLPGTASWVAQLIDGMLAYKQFANRPNGTWSFDLAKAISKSCSIPQGLDIFFAMNQRNDANCTNANECVFGVGNDAVSAYSARYYDSVIKEALCKVPWNL